MPGCQSGLDRAKPAPLQLQGSLLTAEGHEQEAMSFRHRRYFRERRTPQSDRWWGVCETTRWQDKDENDIQRGPLRSSPVPTKPFAHLHEKSTIEGIR